MSMISDWAEETMSEGLQYILNNTIFRLLYWISEAVCWIIDILYSLFEVMAGLVKVTYDGEKQYLINIFFGNSTVSKVYWAMALIGFILCFVFTIIAVIKKMFDLEGKMQTSMGLIVGNCVKSIAIIGLMTAFMLALLNTTNVMIQQVTYIFNNADDLGEEKTITYTDEEYAAMARVLNTIGNYSLNPAWTSRYNINSCFNDFREDLQWLYDQGVFDVYYDDDVIKHSSWQSELEKIVYTADLSKDLPLNTYNENLQAALEHTVEVMQTDKSFKPIESYERAPIVGTESVSLAKILFLSCTMRAANNDSFNENASFTDALRGPYYTGDKSIYDYDTVITDFDIGLSTDYLLLFIVGWIMVKDLLVIIFTCISRIFNMVLLYLISPPLIAASPLDGGNKLRQWVTAMIVQSFGVFGTIISMRIMMLLIPIILSNDLVLFDNVLLNIIGKIILIVGALEVETKAQGLITGILADNAGWQAINAGDMRDTAGKILGGATSMVKNLPSNAWKVGKGAYYTGKYGGKGAWTVGKYGAKGIWNAGKYGVKGAYYTGKGIVAAGGMIGSGIGALKDKYNNYQKTKAAEAQRKATAVNPYAGTEMTDASTWGQNNQQVNQPAMPEPAMVQPEVNGPAVAGQQVNQPAVAQPQPAMPEPAMVQPAVNNPQVAQPAVNNPQVAQPANAQPGAQEPNKDMNYYRHVKDPLSAMPSKVPPKINHK